MIELSGMASLSLRSSVDQEGGHDLPFDSTRNQAGRGRGRGSHGGSRRSREGARGRSASRGRPFGSHPQTGTEDSRRRERRAQSEGFHSGFVGPTLVRERELFNQRRGRRDRGGRGMGTERHLLGNFDQNCHREKADGSQSRSGNRRGRSQSSTGERRSQRNPAGTKYLSQDEINVLSSKDSSDLVRYITENERGFLAAYGHQPNCGHSPTLKHLIKFLYLLVRSDENVFFFFFNNNLCIMVCKGHIN